MNTNVTRGAGDFVVTATGMATQVGQISGLLQAEQATKTPLTRQLDRLTGQILVIAGLALIASMALNLARGETFIAVFNAAIAFAIAAIPVGLPTVVTTIPFPTALLAEFFEKPSASAACALYSGMFVMLALAFNASAQSDDEPVEPFVLD